MQYIPPGATLPDEIVATLGPKLRTQGLFSYDYPEKVDSDAAAVAGAFDRAMYTRLYSEAYRDESRVLTGIQASEGIVAQARHLVAYLSEKTQEPKVLERLTNDTKNKINELNELSIGDQRERSHVKAGLRMIEKGLNTVGGDRKRMKEHAFSVENYATVIDKQAKGEYVRRAPFWMEAVNNRSYFALRTGNYPSLQQHLEEIDATAQKSFECASSLPVRESTTQKRQLKRVQRTIRNIQQAMAPHANNGEEAFRPPDNIQDMFTELKTAIQA